VESYRKYSVRELLMEDEDLKMNVTIGLVVSGTYLDVLRLKKHLNDHPDFKVIYNTVSTSHLRVVKADEFEEFQEWRRKKRERGER